MAVREIIQDGAGMLPDVLTGMTQTELEDTLRAILRVLNGGISHGSGLDGHQSGNSEGDEPGGCQSGVHSGSWVGSAPGWL
jgi:hypothetical protein